MKEKNKKDERLDALFSEYAQNEKMPSVNVTQAAKEYMNKERGTEQVAVPVTVTASENGSDRPVNGSRNNKALYIAAIGLFLVLAALICYFALKKPDRLEFLMGLSPVSSEQITEVNADYSEKDFLPFVKSSAVTEYKEYILNEAVDYYEKGDTAAYYISYNSSENIEISVYVEADGLYLTALDEYKQITTEKELDGIIFYFSQEKNNSLCYFNYNNFGYNIKIDTTDRSVANGVLTFISGSFKN